MFSIIWIIEQELQIYNEDYFFCFNKDTKDEESNSGNSINTYLHKEEFFSANSLYA